MVMAVFSCEQMHTKIGTFNEKTSDNASPAASGDDVKTQASIAFKNGDYAKASSLYEKTLKEAPSDQDTLFYYAESLRMSGESRKALVQYESIDKSNLAALEGKGLAYLQTGEIENALDQFNMIIKQDVSRWRTINAIGVINSINGKNEEAMQYYKMALELSNNNPSILNNIALGVGFSGDKEKGISILKNAISSMTEGGIRKQRLENNLALLYGISGKMDEAEKILRKNLPEAAVYNNLGYYAKLASDKKLAWSYLTKAIAASPVYYEKAANNMQGLEESEILVENTDTNSQTLTQTEEAPTENYNLKAKRGTNKLPLPSLRP